MLSAEQILLERVDEMVKVSRRFAQQKLTNKSRLRLQKSMEMMFKAQQKTVLKQLAKLEDMFEESIKPSDLNSIFMLAENKTSTAAEKAMNKAAADGLLKGSKALISELNVNMMFDLSNPKAVEYLNRFGAKKVTQVNDSTRKYINGIVKQSADEGWSYNRTAKAIGERYSDMWVGKPQQHIASRAHFIAVTEAGNAYMEGQMAVGFDLDAVGLKMEKSWSTMNDANVSDGCAENQAVGYIDVKFAFPSGHLRPLRFPGCRCDLLQRVAEGVATSDLPTEVAPTDYRQYANSEEAHRDFNPHYKDWADDLPADQKKAIKGYTNGEYYDLNSDLRAGHSLDTIAKVDSEKANLARTLDKAMETCPPSPEDIMLNRGFNSDDLWQAIDSGKVNVGDVIQESQYLSTSLDARRVDQFGFGPYPIQYRIQAPKGTRFLYVDELSEYKGEVEAILARGTKFEITGITSETVSSGAVKMILDVIIR